MSLRVISTDPRLTRTVRSWGSATERAKRIALLAGSAEIQRREQDNWRTVERWAKVGWRVERSDA